MIRISEETWKEIFQREKEELYSKIQTEFWRGMLWEVLKEHTIQTDFFLVSQDVDFPEVVAYLKNTISSICEKYRLEFLVTESSYRTEIKVRLHNYGILKNMHDELSIVISKDDITMRMLPHSPMINVHLLEDYQLVGRIVEALCDKLFEEKLEAFVDYLETYKIIEESCKGLNIKSIEIAKNSIKTIYEASDEKFKSITQKALYSILVYKGKRYRILHGEFLADPNVLISKLQ